MTRNPFGHALTAAVLALLLAGCASDGAVDPQPIPLTLPSEILSCETNSTTLCSAWERDGDRYAARWSDGAQAVIQVGRFAADSVRFTRTDHTGVSAGMTAVYWGIVEDGRVPNGRVTWTQNGMSWSGQWTAVW